MCNGALLITVGILVFFTQLTTISFTTVTVSAYVVFFGLMMACMECNLSFVGPRIQRNFGFMFTFTGRTLFLIFCGTMALAMGNALGYVMGAATFLNGIFNGYVILVHPAFRTGELSASSDPYGGYTGGEAEIGDFLKRNPEMATKAVTFAASNPELAKAAVSAAQQPAAAPKANPWGSSA